MRKNSISFVSRHTCCGCFVPHASWANRLPLVGYASSRQRPAAGSSSPPPPPGVATCPPPQPRVGASARCSSFRGRPPSFGGLASQLWRTAFGPCSPASRKWLPLTGSCSPGRRTAVPAAPPAGQWLGPLLPRRLPRNTSRGPACSSACISSRCRLPPSPPGLSVPRLEPAPPRASKRVLSHGRPPPPLPPPWSAK